MCDARSKGLGHNGYGGRKRRCRWMLVGPVGVRQVDHTNSNIVKLIACWIPMDCRSLTTAVTSDCRSYGRRKNKFEVETYSPKYVL